MFTTVRCIDIKHVFAVLKDILVDGTLVFMEDGVHMTELEITKEMLIQLTLHGHEMEEYKAHKSPIRINLMEFSNHFGSISKHDCLKVTVDESKLYQNLFTPMQSRTHALQTIPIHKGCVIDASMEWDPSFSMPCIVFHKMVRTLTARSSHIVIELKDRMVTFSNHDTVIQYKVDSQQTYRGSFASCHFSKLQRATHLCQSVDIQLMHEFPILIQYNFGIGLLRIGITSM